MNSRLSLVGILAMVLLLGPSCSNNEAAGGASGGTISTGGTTSAGGATSTGGTMSTGGATSAGGTMSAGGATNAGGTMNAGGATSTGGMTAVTSTGGAGGTGGLSVQDSGMDSGGSTGLDGGPGSDGVDAAGGNTSVPDTGEEVDTGGIPTTDGSPGTGGTIATGGSTGDPGTGGAGGAATGGTGPSPTGGSTAAGGETGSGGATTCGTPATLKEAGNCTGRLVGVALSTQHLSETAYTNAAKDFNYVTPENEMKWSSIEPTRGNFSFTGGDRIVSFASSNGMKVKGHALVWHNQLPSWVSALTNETDVRAAMLAHIKGVVQHYKGKVQAWDVVNEAISLDGTGLRDYVFPRYLGETFIDEAFKAAREADPDAKLYYNDYNCEGLSPKANKVFALVQGMKSRGVPFDGVGLQMHYGKPNEAVPTADFVANLQRYADLGLDLLISEMDVHVCAGLTPTQQQTIYHDLIAACVGQPRCIAITFWGIADKYSWLNGEDDLGCATGVKPLGLLWDDNFKKKPAYTGVMNALLGL